jgi:cation:H+ antiporter
MQRQKPPRKRFLFLTIFLQILLFIAGLALVIKGGDIFVDASVWISDVSGVSKAVIGATLVSFATTSPELFTSLLATLKGYNDIAIGNAVGSPIANLGLGFALIAIFTPGAVRDTMYKFKGALMILSTAALLVFSLDGSLGIADGIILILLFGANMYLNIKFRCDEDCAPRRATNRREITVNIFKFAAGIAAIILGSNLLVDNGQELALALNISPTVVGLTFVAVGTSLPELVTAIAAITKKQSSLSIGNIVGANILDTTLILSVCSFVSGGNLAVSADTARVDLPASLFIMAASVLPVVFRRRLFRFQGVIMIAAYACYIAYIAIPK